MWNFQIAKMAASGHLKKVLLEINKSMFVHWLQAALIEYKFIYNYRELFKPWMRTC
jgi:hypothetical protein